MTGLEDAREMIKNMLSEHLEGRSHENTENYLNQIQKDYEEVYEREGDTGVEWKRKYEDLKEKYVERFTSGNEPTQTQEERFTSGNEPTQTQEESVSHIEENNEDEVIETMDTTIEDLFE